MRPKIIILLLLLSSPVALFAQDAREIVKKANDLFRGKSTYAEISMTIIKPEWSRTVTMKVWSLEPKYSLVYVTSPARDKGSVTLKRKNEVWNWLPSVQRTIKIPPSMMLQSWMGSDFTNDDLVRQSSIVDDYTHRIIGTDTVEGYSCWEIELIPKPEAGVVWGKLLMWVAKDGSLELRTDFYDEDGSLVKTFIGSDIKKFDGRPIAAHWEMTPVKEQGKKTVLDYHSLVFNKNYEESFFSEENMKRVR